MWNDVTVLQSTDQNVKKYVFIKDNAVAESVLYKYPTYKDRTVICCSTQSGCQIGCRFCGTGDYFVRSFNSDEIVSQPVRLLNDTGVDPIEMGRLQIMFMSMGEPLMNLRNLIPALHKLYELYPNAALLISTSGPKVDYEPLMKVAEEIPTIGLQFSVHESTNEARDKLIPFKAKLTLEEISKKGEEFFYRTNRTPFFNYCAHPDNVSDEDVSRLSQLFNTLVWQATISVICERDETISVAHKRQKELADGFERKLSMAGYRTRVFDPAGQDDIGGGCGQLFYVQEWMRNNPQYAKPTFDQLPIVHSPQ